MFNGQRLKDTRAALFTVSTLFCTKHRRRPQGGRQNGHLPPPGN